MNQSDLPSPVTFARGVARNLAALTFGVAESFGSLTEKMRDLDRLNDVFRESMRIHMAARARMDRITELFRRRRGIRRKRCSTICPLQITAPPRTDRA